MQKFQAHSDLVDVKFVAGQGVAADSLDSPTSCLDSHGQNSVDGVLQSLLSQSIVNAWVLGVMAQLPQAQYASNSFLQEHFLKFVENLLIVFLAPQNLENYFEVVKLAESHGIQRGLAGPYTFRQAGIEYSVLSSVITLFLPKEKLRSTQHFFLLSCLINTALEASQAASQQSEILDSMLRPRQTILFSSLIPTVVLPALVFVGEELICEFANASATNLLLAHPVGQSALDIFSGDAELVAGLQGVYRTQRPFATSGVRCLLVYPGELRVAFLPYRDLTNQFHGVLVYISTPPFPAQSVISSSDFHVEHKNSHHNEFQNVLKDELKGAKKDLGSEQQKFRTLFADATTSLAVLKGKELVFEIANRSYLELFNNRELIGKPFSQALPELEGQEFPTRAREVFETGVAYKDPEAKACLRRTDNGELEERYFDQAYTRMLDQDGNPYGVFIHAIEVTDRVRARRDMDETSERFRIAVEAANMGTWEIDPKTSAINWSTRTGELMGIKGEESRPLSDILHRIHPEDRAAVATALSEAMCPTSDGRYEMRNRIVRDDGETRWVSVRGKAFFSHTLNKTEGRTITRFTGTILDITDPMMAEVALREAKERAELANAAKSTFLANMSHEIRTPLGAIMGFVSLIKDADVSQQMLLEYVSIVERNSTQLLRIIDDILDLSKVEAGMMLIEHIDFSLIELLSDFGSFMGFRAREKGILFEMKAKTELPNMINSDPTRIRQILTNVVGNAIKFTERGMVQLHISYQDGLIHFEVEDTGRGISEEQDRYLFQPFSQGDVSTTRKYGGTGLGLVLTRRLSEVLGGSFELKSSVIGQGSVFTSTIKVELPEGTQMVRALGFASEAIRNAGVSIPLGNIHILLVEDSPDNQALFSIYLSRAGAKVDIASDGSHGCEMALAERYDVVIMDVQMPIMDGISAVRKLRSCGYRVPVVALTAHAMKEERIRCLDAGYTDFLSKPTQRSELIDCIQKHVKQAAAL